MRIWVDGQSLQTASRLRGIGRFVVEFLRALKAHPAIDRIDVSLNAGMGHEAIEARSLLDPIVDAPSIHLWHGRAEAGEAATGVDVGRRVSHLALVHHVNCLAPDIALSPSPFEGQADPAVPLLPHPALTVPAVAVFHDAIPHRFPNLYLTDPGTSAYYRRRLKAHQAFDGLLGVSEFSAAEARTLIPGVETLAIGEGLSAAMQSLINQGGGNDEAPPIAGRYALYVGGLDARKNVNALLDAWPLLPQSVTGDMRLVLAGDHPRPLERQLADRWARLGLQADALVLLNTVDDATLVRLYRSAAVVVQPSLMEGFGLTALEALACGVPVIASTGGAIPEVVGEDRLLFDPTSKRALAERLSEVLSGRIAPEIVHAAAERAIARHTWPDAADRAVAMLQRVQRDTGEPASRPALRAQIAPAVVACTRTRADKTLAATLMACAEPSSAQQRRLVVDATSTRRDGNKTGIQRVVNKICPALPGPARAHGFDLGYVYCDDTDGWYLSTDWGDGAAQKARQERWHCVPSDRLLMLDSSWEFQNIHRRRLREARAHGVDVVSTLFDLVPLKMPAMCAGGMPEIFSAWLRTALTYSTGFVCISRSVADELYALLRALAYPRPMKIGYWPLGADFAAAGASPADDPSRQATSNDPARFLMVGTVEPRKGHWVALRAFETLWAAGIDVRLDIVGKPGWSTDALIDWIQTHPEAGHRLFWHQQSSDEELADHYRAAAALLACSYAEGFGLPIVEAGHFGRPAIVSDLPVFREVGVGSADVQFFPVGDAIALAEMIKTFLATQPTKPSFPHGDRPGWPDWADSAHRLADIVLRGDWYRIYQPTRAAQLPAIADIGRAAHRAVVPPNDRRYRLWVPDVMVSIEAGAILRLSVWLENRSSLPLSGETADSTAFPVFLEAVLEPSRLTPGRQSATIRAALPWVVLPRDRVCLPLDLRADLVTDPDDQITIHLVQNGVVWTEGATTHQLSDLLPRTRRQSRGTPVLSTAVSP